MRKMKSWLPRTLQMQLALSLVLGVFTASVFAAADAYPTKPVRIIVPTGPGGSSDIMARRMAAKLSERLGKQVIVENRGGGGSVIGTEMVAKANPDGYTLLTINPTFTIQPALHTLPYDPVKSFTPIAKLGSGAMALVVHPSVPAKSVKELIALAKEKPGQLIFASAGAGSLVHMVIELFIMMADIDVKITQFKGGGPSMIDLLGGHSHAAINSLAQALPHIKSGKFRALGTSGSKRSAILPEVPTIAEAGVPGYEAAIWWGFTAPAGTPEPVVKRLTNEIKAIMGSDDIKKALLNSGAEVDYQGPAEFDLFLKNEMAKWARVIKKANIKL